MMVYLVMGWDYENTDHYGIFATREAAQRRIEELTVPIERVFMGKTYIGPKNGARFQIFEEKVQE